MFYPPGSFSRVWGLVITVRSPAAIVLSLGASLSFRATGGFYCSLYPDCVEEGVSSAGGEIIRADKRQPPAGERGKRERAPGGL